MEITLQIGIILRLDKKRLYLIMITKQKEDEAPMLILFGGFFFGFVLTIYGILYRTHDLYIGLIFMVITLYSMIKIYNLMRGARLLWYQT